MRQKSVTIAKRRVAIVAFPGFQRRFLLVFRFRCGTAGVPLSISSFRFLVRRRRRSGLFQGARISRTKKLRLVDVKMGPLAVKGFAAMLAFNLLRIASSVVLVVLVTEEGVVIVEFPPAPVDSAGAQLTSFQRTVFVEFLVFVQTVGIFKDGVAVVAPPAVRVRRRLSLFSHQFFHKLIDFRRRRSFFLILSRHERDFLLAVALLGFGYRL